MGRRGRRPHPDILTPREWEVIDLLRQRLTNEQIAERLSITLDGAKYHVSQILSKLSVGTREEAAAWSAREIRPSWMRRITLPAAAAVAGALTLAVIGALGLLAWGVAETGGPPQSSEPASSVALAECKDSTSVLLDGAAACEFRFEAKDFPARLEGGANLANPQHGYPFYGVIILYCNVRASGKLPEQGYPRTGHVRTNQLNRLGNRWACNDHSRCLPNCNSGYDSRGAVSVR